jgi:type I restriction enzyme S subunit
MSRLDELIAELCPSGVKYVPLKQIAEVGTGSSDRVNAVDDGEYPFYVRSKNILRSNRYLFDEEAIIIPGEGGIGDIFHYVNGKYDLHQRAYRIHLIDPNVNTKFTYYCLSANFKKFIIMKAVNATVTSIRKPMIENFQIPLPPLPVQQEIVRILDNFTKLTAELTAELTARRKQYEYYRDFLLTFGDEVEWTTLGEVAINLDSKRKPVAKGKRKAGEYPYYGASGIVDYVDDYIFDGDYLLVSEDGANLVARVTPIAFSASGKIWVNNHAHVLEFETYEDRKFIEYYLNMIDLSRFLSTAAQPKLTQENLNKIPVPAPSFEEKERIVAILDRFDALCNDLTSGIPAEIEARQKQYEYYRDKLLSFKEVTA